MASRQSTVDYIVEQIAEAGTVYAKKMFGEYGIFCDGKMVALVCDDQLFVKPTAVGKAYIGEFVEGSPYPGAKPYLLITGDKWDDRDWLVKLLQITTPELPLPQKKLKKSVKRKE
ncbi:TfoX/Sxy family protein [Candidatus Chlorohelix sp.]|uniref:TfoX/Sxy family protein n=1 Tax=Candidatus Chlorohelix sp. TaxID=3139201 RepID=UPI003024CF35